MCTKIVVGGLYLQVQVRKCRSQGHVGPTLWVAHRFLCSLGDSLVWQLTTMWVDLLQEYWWLDATWKLFLPEFNFSSGVERIARTVPSS